MKKTVHEKKETGTVPPGKRASNKEKVKKAILEASLELFKKKGFSRTATREIAQKAGIAEGTIFNYFRTKEDLALYFFEQELLELMEWYEEQEDLTEAPLPEKLFAVIHRHLEQISPYEDFIGSVYLRALQVSSKLSPLSIGRRELNLRYLKFIQEILDEAGQRGEIPNVGEFGAYGVGLFHLAMITYWLHDTSINKENTLAMLDRCLNFSTRFLRGKANWEW